MNKIKVRLAKEDFKANHEKEAEQEYSLPLMHRGSHLRRSRANDRSR